MNLASQQTQIVKINPAVKNRFPLHHPYPVMVAVLEEGAEELLDSLSEIFSPMVCNDCMGFIGEDSLSQ
jgi:hypothetical protein